MEETIVFGVGDNAYPISCEMTTQVSKKTPNRRRQCMYDFSQRLRPKTQITATAKASLRDT